MNRALPGTAARIAMAVARLTPFGAGLAACLVLTIPPAGPTDRDRAELKGPVRTVSSRWQANHKDEYGSVDERELGSTTYDAAGNLLVQREITPDFSRDVKIERHGPGEALFRSTMGSSVERYRFDRAGNMTQRQIWYGDKASDTPAITERFTYDSAGRMASREALAGDGSGKRFDVRFYTRDAAGNVIVEETRYTDSLPPYPRMHYTYQFDAHGNWTARIVTRENVPETSYEFRYAGNLFRTITYFGPADSGPPGH